MSLHSPSEETNGKKDKEEHQISFEALITAQNNLKQNDTEKDQHSSASNRQESMNVASTDQSNSTQEKTSKSTFVASGSKKGAPQALKLTGETPPALSAGPFIGKDSYLDLLINSANMLMSSGKVTEDYLNSVSLCEREDSPMKVTAKSSEVVETSFFSKKCENKSCAVIVDKPSDIFQAKILSQKSKSLWLCSKCHSAWKGGQYCYYCNIIYRDFGFNQQYYDSKTWIECDYCLKWTHLECEEKKGKLTSIKKLIQNSDFKYKCPMCLIEAEKERKAEEDVQLLKKKRSAPQHITDTDSKNKKKNPNDVRRFLQCDDSFDMINDLELVVNFNDN